MNTANETSCKMSSYNLKNEVNVPISSADKQNVGCYIKSNDPIIDIPLKSTEKNEKGIVNNIAAEDDGHGTVDHPTSYAETLMHLLRGNIGPGMMSMGNAFKNAGIILAPFGIVTLGIICIHCQHVLLTVATEMKRRTGMANMPGFSQTVELCFSTGHPSLRKYASVVRNVVTLFLCITQLGICCVYFVFISKHIEQILIEYNVHINIHYHMAIILLPILLTCLVRNLKYLAPLSTIANLLMLTGIIIILYFVTQDLPPISSRNYIANVSTMPLFFGTALFAFEGIALVLPMQREMKEPKHFKKPFGVLNIGMTIVTSLFTIMGFLAYLKFGESIKGSVTLDLDPKDVLSQVVKLIISLGILLTYTLQFYVPAVILWAIIIRKYGPFNHPVLMESLFRTLLVLCTFTLAEVIPYLELFISLVGAVSSTALAILIPPVIEMVSKWNVSKISAFVVIKNVLILLLGILGCVTGTYESISNIVDAISKDLA